MTLRWIVGSLLLAVVLTGCIVVPAHPVVVRPGRPYLHHAHPHYYHYPRYR
jgi:hypothetical protein